MPNIDKAFGMHEQALKLRSYRMELLASNLANADTPNYKARDIDFKGMLRQYQLSGQMNNTVPLRTTQSGHIASNGPNGMAIDPDYRVPMQPSLDGNTVDPQSEKAAMMDNSIRYQATLTFLDSRIKSMRKALGGK